MTPTAEQAACADKFATGRKLRINAYAGTGKTSTLKLLARGTRRHGTYLAFNKSIADEAGKEFPSHVACSTQHSLAVKSAFKTYSREKLFDSVNGGFVAARRGLQGFTLGNPASPDGISVSSRGFGFLVCETLKHWQQSGRPELSDRDVRLGGKLDLLPLATMNGLRARVLIETRKVWADMVDPRGQLPLGHDGYLKLWALSKPIIPGDFVFVDEAQDTNGVFLEVVRHQPAQVVTVGDRHQQIYEWRGAMNAMELIPCELEARLSTSFRFGPAIAAYASHVLGFLGETLPLTGNPAKPSRVGPLDGITDAVLARTNSRLLEELTGAVDAGRKPFVVGGVKELLMIIDAAETLMEGRPVDRPLDFFGFASWKEVEEASENDDGADLKRWVKLFQAHDPVSLRRLLEGLPRNEAGADLILSTGHKSKGREWDRVRLCDDFLRGVSTDRQDGAVPIDVEALAPELRLFYVAATRGRVGLEIPAPLQAKLDLIGRYGENAMGTAPAAPSAPVVATVAPTAPAALADAPAPYCVDPFPGVDVSEPEAPAADPIDPFAGVDAPATVRRGRWSKAQRALVAELVRAAMGSAAGERRELCMQVLDRVG